MNKSVPNLVIGFVAILLLVMVYFTTNKREPTYLEYTNSMYKVSWECIRTHYTDNLTEDGKVFSIYSIHPDCDAIFLEILLKELLGMNPKQSCMNKQKNYTMN